MSTARSRMTRLALSGLLGGAVALVGCASSAGEGMPRVDPNLLTLEEMTVAAGSNLYEVVDRLRPRWLQARGPRSVSGDPGAILVYFNESYLGGPDELRNFDIASVEQIRYLGGSRAAALLTGYPSTIHVAGAIILETVARGDV